MGVHEFYTTIEQNDVIGLVDSLAEKAGTPYRGVVPSGSTTPTIQHDLNTTDVDVTVIRVADKLQVGVPAERVDANNVKLTFATAPTGGQYRVIVSAGTGTGGTGGGGGGSGGTPDPHAASHASNGTDPVSPESIGAALTGHSHSSDYAPLTHASRHATAGADPISPSSIGAASSVHSHSGTDITSGTVAFGRLPTGTTSTTVAIGNHTHSGGSVPAHATTHALEGTDPLTPDDIGAALANHNHNGRIIPAGGTSGQALVKASGNDYDVEWGSVSGGDTPVYNPSVIKPFPAVNIIPQQFKYTYSGAGPYTSQMARINAQLGTHFRIDYTYVSSSIYPIEALRIDNPTDGQSILIEYRNLSTAASGDQWGLDRAFIERNWQAAPYAAVSGQTPGPADITNYDLGGIFPEAVMWQSLAYYGLIYDARGRGGAGVWRLMSNVVGYSI